MIRTSVAILTALVVLLCEVTYGQSWRTFAEYQASNGKERRDTLGLIGSHKVTPSSQSDLLLILSSAVSDSDVDIRLAGLKAIQGRAGAARFVDQADVIERWRNERHTLLLLREPVLTALNDGDERVRKEAVVALGNLAYELSGSRAEPIFDDMTLTQLFERFSVESSALVREEIVKDAPSGGNSAIRARIIEKGLDDSDPGVLAFAARGAGKLQDLAALPKVVALLGHTDRNVRLQAALALTAFGALASTYLPDVRGAANREADPIVKRTLESVAVALGK